MTNRTWHKGPPPHVGWWNASNSGSYSVWRWWNGKHWSDFVSSDESAAMAGICATTPCATNESFIEWTKHWPRNARVERTKP